MDRLPSDNSTDQSPILDSLESSRNFLAKLYKILLCGVGVLFLAAGIYTATVATTANGLALVALILLAVAGFAFLNMGKYDRRPRSNPPASAWPPIKFTVQEEVSEPVVGYMDNDAIARAQSLHQQGASLDAICREVNPNYAELDALHQIGMQKLMQTVLQHYSNRPLSPPSS